MRDAQDERLAAWLECHNWWRWAFLTCAGSCARTASPSAQSTVLRTQTWITAQF